jgi:hypothetical protein
MHFKWGPSRKKLNYGFVGKLKVDKNESNIICKDLILLNCMLPKLPEFTRVLLTYIFLISKTSTIEFRIKILEKERRTQLRLASLIDGIKHAHFLKTLITKFEVELIFPFNLAEKRRWRKEIVLLNLLLQNIQPRRSD